MKKAKRALTIFFGGAGREGVVLALKRGGHSIGAVVVPRNLSARLGRSVAAIRKAGIRVVRAGKNELERFSGGILISIGFPYLVPEKVLRRFELCLNLHPTLLPRYRGPTTAAYVLINRERYSGSTVHVMDKSMDHGAIVLQRKVRLSRFDTIRSLQNKVYGIEPRLMVDALKLIRRPGFRPRPQNQRAATVYRKKRTPADSRLNPALPLSRLYDFIRACDPADFPAYFYVEGQKVCIRLWRAARPAGEDPDAL
jgi:methionyl-tRNA formyltransferase